MRILICGGGVIGVSIAWFLAKRGGEPVVIERTGTANAASGKSGGFLALDWSDGTALAPLARRSFALHASLAQEIEDDWGYRCVDTYGGHAGARAGHGKTLAWLTDDFAVTQRLGSTETTAQVHPGRFSAAMMRAAKAKGAVLRLGRVTGLTRQDRRVTGVIVDGAAIEGDAVVIAMGPWSILAAEWLPLPVVYGLKGHSLVFDTGTNVPAEALFAEYREATGALSTPEVFPRNDGTTYVCAISSETPLPIDPADVAPDSGAIERLEAICRRLSPVLAKAKVLAAQACYRPVDTRRPAAHRPRIRFGQTRTSPPAIVSGAFSTRRRQARRWPSSSLTAPPARSTSRPSTQRGCRFLTRRLCAQIRRDSRSLGGSPIVREPRL
jgi:glycine/D-amino acid oxidase-like deaminating enzyme